MAAPSLGTAGTLVANSGVTQITVYYPTGSAGDIVIIHGLGQGAVYINASGFTPIYQSIGPPTKLLAWKRATSTSGGSTTLSYVSGSNVLKGICYRFTNCIAAGDPQEIYPTEYQYQSNGASYYCQIPSITTGGADRLGAAFCVVNDASISLYDDATYYSKENAQDTTIGDDTTFALYTYPKSSAGAISSDQFGLSVINTSHVILAKIYPVSFTEDVYSVKANYTDKVCGVDDVDITSVAGADTA